MRTYFYGTSLYSHMSHVELPKCFVELDEILGAEDSNEDIVLAMNMPKVKMAENICRRMADIDWYANNIEAATQEDNIGKATFLTMTLLVGYFGSCKSLLDAAAISLNEINSLGLKEKEQDLGKGRFWNQLIGSNFNAFKKYKPFRSLGREVIKWRDSAVHRQSPIILPNGITGERPRDELKIWLINDPEPRIQGHAITVAEGENVRINPLSLHTKWRSKFVSLCGQLCSDIGAWSV